MTERLHFDFSLSCTGEGNGKPLQCSCLENLRDGGAWWAAIYGVAQSRTRLKRLSSSSSSHTVNSHWLSISHVVVYMFLCYSLQFVPSSSSHPVTTSRFSMSRSTLLPCKQVLQYHLSRVHTCALIYDI